MGRYTCLLKKADLTVIDLENAIARSGQGWSKRFRL